MEELKNRIEQLEQAIGAMSTQISMMHTNTLDLSIMASTIATAIIEKGVIEEKELTAMAKAFQQEMQEVMQAASPDAVKAKEVIKDIEIAGL